MQWFNRTLKFANHDGWDVFIDGSIINRLLLLRDMHGDDDSITPCAMVGWDVWMICKLFALLLVIWHACVIDF